MVYTKRIGIKIGKLLVCLLSLAIVVLCTPAMNFCYAEVPGKIVVVNDDSPLSLYGVIYSSYSAQIFANNVAGWFTEGLSGNFATNDSYAFYDAYLNYNLNGEGYSWEYLPEFPNDLDTLLSYDGIFISGEGVDNNILIQYVNSGGNVYLSGGAGYSAINEASQWNTFLEYFGLAFAPVTSSDPNEYNNVFGTIGIESAHPIFEGVLYLYQEFGNDIVDLDPMDDRGKVLVSYQGSGLYAVFDGSQGGSDIDGSIDQEDNQADYDSDDIPDVNDACPSTSQGEIVDIDGCSISDLCPCGGQWKNHGSYVKCAAKESKYFVSEGLMSEDQKGTAVSIAAQSRCGHKK